MKKLKLNITRNSEIKTSQNFYLFREKENGENILNGKLQKLFSGKKNQFFLKAEENSLNFYIGLGKNPSLGDIKKSAQKFSAQFKNNFLSENTTLFAADFSAAEIAEAVLGLFAGTYEYQQKTHPLLDEKFTLNLSEIQDLDLPALERKITAVCSGKFLCMDWMNKPYNYKNPEIFKNFLLDFAAENNLEIEILNREKCRELGLGAYLSVNKGSAYDACFAVLRYNCNAESSKTIGLVGKCVLFDTGGISLKDPANMHYMKSDLGGAAAVLGTLAAVSNLKMPVNIIAVLPVTDNAVSRDAFVPSDVVTAYNGKKIEVLNTDAEGRMTLADGLSYLSKNFKTEVIIDLATLTGSAVRMFGDTCGVLFSNNDNLKNEMISAGEKTGERLWNLPLWDIWKEDISSDVADLKNISLKPIGDCIVAAKFLEEFIENHPNWAHLDIAGVAFGNTDYSKEKAATSYGVELLLEYIENFIYKD